MYTRVEERSAKELLLTAQESECSCCGSPLKVSQHRSRYVQRLDALYHVIRRDKRCPHRACKGRSLLYRPLEDLRFALPRMSFGLDVVLAVGESHLSSHRSLRDIGRLLNHQGVPLHQTHVGQLFRSFLSLTSLARGDLPPLKAKLAAQGGIVLMLDGVQFDPSSPVLYLAWDALSGTPLFGARQEFRAQEDFFPLLERVKRMEVPVLAVVSDKEKGLVPAVAQVFSEVPHQFCQTHFLKNCAEPLKPDLSALGASVQERATAVQKLAKQLHEKERVAPTRASKLSSKATPKPPPALKTPKEGAQDTLSERELVTELCALVKQNAQASGKAPLNPPELVRHQKLEAVREVVRKARQKKGRETGEPEGPPRC